MAAVVIDTDILSFRFKKDSRARLYRKHLVGRDWVLSFMTLAELDLWANTHNWGSDRRAKLELFLGSYAVLYPDRDVCRLWAEVSDGARRNGRPIECADAWIATTALALGVGLVTHNPADYLGVNGLTVFSEATT